MAIKVGINGYGRIGRNVLRALYEGKRTGEIQIVAINDLGDAQTNAHLTRYDTAHGKFHGEVHVDGNAMVVNGDRIRVLAERDPAKLPWGELGADYVLECTGLFTSKAKAGAHLKGGAKRVVISAPGGEDVDATIVYGVNDKVLKSSHTVISNASCTTNCLAPVAKVLHDKLGISAGIMTTIHSYTNDQVLTDVYHSDLRRARSATMSMIPTKTGAAAAVGLVLPELKGKLDGFAVRVPTINVSLVDLTFTAKRATTVEEVNKTLQQAAADGPLQGILGYTDGPLVSVDFNHDPHSSIFDATLTKVIEGTLVKVCSWYDNEWGFSNRMLDTTLAWSKALMKVSAHDRSRPARQAGADPRGSQRAGAGRRGDQRCAHPRRAADHPATPLDQHAGVRALAPRAARRKACTTRSSRSRRSPRASRSCSASTVPLRKDWLDGVDCRARAARCCARTCASTRARRRTTRSWRGRWPPVRRVRDGRVRHRASRRGQHARRGAASRRSPAPARCWWMSSTRSRRRCRSRSGRWSPSSPARRSPPS